MKKIDLTGQRFGRLVVCEEFGRSRAGKICWKCICDCGNFSIVHGTHLQSGHTQSCGCFLRESKIKHGLYRSPEYCSWDCMVQRTTNPANAQYKFYGGRGITVCDSWRNSFEAFLHDMGKRPPNTSIGRIDNDDGYYKENCRWETQVEQSRNQRIRRDNTTGMSGVQWDKRRRKYLSRIMVYGEEIYLGRFKDIKDAEQARKFAEQKYWQRR